MAKETAEKKLSYAELEKKVKVLEMVCKEQEKKAAAQMGAANAKIGELYEALSYRRLDFLFKVVKYKDAFPGDFVVTCTDEIVKTMTIPEDEPKEKKEE